jgi:hypothetical protein
MLWHHAMAILCWKVLERIILATPDGSLGCLPLSNPTKYSKMGLKGHEWKACDYYWATITAALFSGTLDMLKISCAGDAMKHNELPTIKCLLDGCHKQSHADASAALGSEHFQGAIGDFQQAATPAQQSQRFKRSATLVDPSTV